MSRKRNRKLNSKRRKRPKKYRIINTNFVVNDIVYVKYFARPKPTRTKEYLFQIKTVYTNTKPPKLYLLEEISTRNTFYAEHQMLIKINNNDQMMFRPILDVDQMMSQNI